MSINLMLRENTSKSLPKPVWTGRLPDRELRPAVDWLNTARHGLFAPAYYGIEIAGNQLDLAAVKQIVLVLDQVAEACLRGDTTLAFICYGKDKRQVILPVRNKRVSPGEAREHLNYVLRRATATLEQQGLPAVDLPPQQLDPFVARQYWQQ